MREGTEHHIAVRKTARYFVLGDSEAATESWYVLHGYRQSASRFMRRFAELDDGTRTIVAPEALNRFYVTPELGRHGPKSRVGGTWMTREDRLTEIDDYVAYLDALRDHMVSDDATTTVLGFSQGVATASRWAVLGKVRPARLILWGDYLPPDLDMAEAAAALNGTELIIVRGSEDPSLDEALRLKEERRLGEAGIRYRFVSYRGGHDIDRETLLEIAAQ